MKESKRRHAAIVEARKGGKKVYKAGPLHEVDGRVTDAKIAPITSDLVGKSVRIAWPGYWANGQKCKVISVWQWVELNGTAIGKTMVDVRPRHPSGRVRIVAVPMDKVEATT